MSDRDDEAARQLSRRSLEHDRATGGSRRTILIALAANALVAVTKLAAGPMSGSSALLAEAAHSTADTGNQVFLLVSLGLSAREPSEDQPFGHGHQRFLWTFVAAIGMFLAGAVFAIGYGIVELLAGSEESGGAWSPGSPWRSPSSPRGRRGSEPSARPAGRRARRTSPSSATRAAIRT